MQYKVKIKNFKFPVPAPTITDHPFTERMIEDLAGKQIVVTKKENLNYCTKDYSWVLQEWMFEWKTPLDKNSIKSVAVTNGGSGSVVTTSYNSGSRKDSEGKLDYSEINWDFIDAMAARMNRNKDKYPPKNYESMNEEEIKGMEQATLRHLRKILQPLKDDSESVLDHLAAIGCNAMILYYLNKNKQ